MKLLLKVNIVMVIVFLIGLAASYTVAKRLLQQNARSEIQEHARIMMESALAVRAYTVSQIKPLLETQMRYKFLPQTVPSYSATEYFNILRKSFPEYAYKEATLNPTNLRDRAVDWEVDVVNYFRQHADVPELVGERDAATGKTLYLARPLRILDERCLACHSSGTVAPPTMLDLYGSSNGFGWQLKDVIGAQVVSVPYELPLKRANAALRNFVYLLVGLFLFLFVAVNILVSTLVVRRVRKLAAIADQVSGSATGIKDAPDFPVKGRDEIAVLGASFNRMRRSLAEAIDMLQ
jgi:HAMP domain-containing protein